MPTFVKKWDDAENKFIISIISINYILKKLKKGEGLALQDMIFT
jgi:hypothetical protein